MTKNILWIEDDVDIIGGLIFPLTKKGYNVNIVKSKHEYLKINDETIRAFDLIVLDILLPEGFKKKPTERYTGFSVLEHIRQSRKLTTPVIILSVVRNDELLKEMKKLKISKIMSKPKLPSELEEEVEKIIGEK